MFWSQRKAVPYITLAETNSASLEENEEFLPTEHEEEKGFEDGPVKKKSKPMTILIGIIVVLSIVNLTLFIRHYSNKIISTVETPDSDLELANAYIGLDKLYTSVLNYTIENMPLAVHSVDREHPNTVRPDETPNWWTFQGTIVPDRRHIFINETISTIIQFRTLDFGLEICQPSIVLPTYASLVNSTVKSEDNKPRSFAFSPPFVPVQIWALDSIGPNGRELELELSQLSYAVLPRRKAYLGTIDAREGVRGVAKAFVCESASLHILELSCDTPGCMLDFWTDMIEPRMAFVIEQSSA
ncbi:hypothetical protein SCHPADRAFT_886311 [Schizopora paradoxa]|uniref:Ubiquitin 3 binding protein But2 C-terminal domain-containing protein n=1 Tax=Schizopora paradoxa TaxID=27342 RepID=A0A0H2S1K7_9AGAM|nr:hypothetical protein SCHPADRAFT_886311 [Schizopora paradoxa]